MNKEGLIKKYKIDISKLEKEQLELAKKISTKDKIDFTQATLIAGIDNLIIKNTIISAVVLINKEGEIIEKNYVIEKTTFPYLPNFRAYRELPATINAVNNLNEKPDVIFVPAKGISHPTLGMATHLSISTGIPTIGIYKVDLDNETKGENIIKNKKIVGKKLKTKKESNEIFISPGNNISVETALEITKKLIFPPHKMPEPIHQAGKYVKQIKRETNQKLS